MQNIDEAVTVATEEEALEAATKEEEVLSCFQGDPSEQRERPLINSIVAALDEREAARERNRNRAKETPPAPVNQQQAELQEGGPSFAATATPAYNNYHSQQFPEQLPLPRAGYRDFREGGRGGGRGGRGRWGSSPRFIPNQNSYDTRICFLCHRPGHIRWFCPEQNSGNGTGRLN